MCATFQKVRTKPRNTRCCVLRAWALNVTVCLVALAPIKGGAEDYTEIVVELNSTWQSQSLTNHHHLTATCIVATNGWFISGKFLKNARVDYWLVGTNIVEYMTLEEANDLLRDRIFPYAHSYPRAGETTIRIHPSSLGRPVFSGLDGAIWLAFCSGDYLMIPGRKIPKPIGPFGSSRYVDRTVHFDEPRGLPKSVQLFAKNGTPVCDYEVLAATNYLGRTFPLRFRVMQRGQPDDGSFSSESRTDLQGQVISIGSGKWPEFPADVRIMLKEP